MSYNPVTDFLGLIRRSTSGAAIESMPGLDFVMSALARTGLIRLSVGQDAPTTNLQTTVWLKPAEPSWTAEGTVLLYDGDAGEFVPATEALWAALLAVPNQQVYQNVLTGVDTVQDSTTLLAVRRTIAVPTVTMLTLPSVNARLGKQLQIVDWSVVLAEHTIVVLTPAGETVMRRTSFNFYSTLDQLAGVTLTPSTDLSGWVIAP